MKYTLVCVLPILCSLAHSDTLTVIEEFQAPCPRPWGLAWDGTHIWVSDDSLGRISMVDNAGTCIDSMEISVGNLRGMTFYQNSLWVISSTGSGFLFQIDTDNKTIIDTVDIQRCCPLWGVSFWNSKCYISYDGGYGSCMYEFDLMNGTRKKLCCAHPGALTTIRDVLWCVRMGRGDGAGRYVMPLTIEDEWSDEEWELRHDLDFFAMGTTYDGHHIWLCDRNAGKIKKMEKMGAGDVNGDGIIDILDAVVAINIMLGTIEPTPDQVWLADMNGDGGVDILDVVEIIEEILG